MKANKPNTIYLKDYTVPSFLIDSIALDFDLAEAITTVKSKLLIKRNPQFHDRLQPLVLNGEELKLISIHLNGKRLIPGEYEIAAESLTIANVPNEFILETEVEIEPQKNTKLSGLYKSRNIFCTQCESHGFRRITYYLDRPDVLSRFTTTITADQTRYPLLLANGNLIEQKQLDNNRHWVKWEDPSLKPCYLFALVAGNLDFIEDIFITQSGRTVKLFVYVEPGKREQARFAMQSLKNAMRWDEETYGREYELDIYMVVAVSDFNFGAMENKGLNIFNDKYILADPQTATDEDFIHIEEVIGHEYFHNWSGNRVTVRDWFQITLKEGLTVFRDESFSADMNSKAVKRIQDVRAIRSAQFLQDAGPMAHPIMPDSYIEVNNFYTVTVYQKGAEVICMLQTLLGKEMFRKAMDLYFSRNDGHAVTTEDFIKAMEDASGIDLTQFKRWYHQAGTPELIIEDNYDANTHTYTLKVTQSCPPTPQQPVKKEFHIPLAIGLLDKNGKEITLRLANETESTAKSRVLSVKDWSETFNFINVSTKPIPSLLRNFSAPVKLKYDYSHNDLIFLMQHDTDAFNRWDASQQLAVDVLLKLIKAHQQKQPMKVSEEFINAFAYVLENHKADPALTAEMLILPSESYLGEMLEVIDVNAIYEARKFLRKLLAENLSKQFFNYYQLHSNFAKPYDLSAQAMAERKLKNICLAYLAETNNLEILKLSLEQCYHANNMTDTIAALVALNDRACSEREQVMDEFYKKWQGESLVMDKWFSLQAISTLPGRLSAIKSIMQLPVFELKNPNRVRALIGAFCANNHVQFHDRSGAGYEFLINQVQKIDGFNSQLAARILEPMIRWKRYDVECQHLMRTQLEHLIKTPKLSKDVYEIVSRSLE